MPIKEQLVQNTFLSPKGEIFPIFHLEEHKNYSKNVDFFSLFKNSKNMLIFQNMLFEKTVGYLASKYANFSKLASNYAIWQPWTKQAR